MIRLTRTLGAVVLSLALAPAAHAQLVGLKHLWTVPGVMQPGTGLVTVFACTNGGTANQTIGVDIYGPAGAYVAGNSITVAPSATVTFATSAVTDMSIDVNLATGVVSKGHARIFATKGGVLCSAFLADAISGLPTNDLTIAKAFKQKGD